MVTRVWNGTDGVFLDASKWSPNGSPMAGETGVINGGTVTLESGTLAGYALSVASAGGTSPTFQMNSGSIDGGSTVTVAASNVNATFQASGTVTNAGNMIFLSPGAGTATLLLPGVSAPAVLVNQGLLLFDGGVNVSVLSSNNATGITNNGRVIIKDDTGQQRAAFVRAGVDGTGLIALETGAVALFGSGIGAGQTVQFGAGTEQVQLYAPNQVAATFKGLGSGSSIVLTGVRSDSVSYQTTGPSSGNLLVKQGGAVVDTLAMSGDYAPNSFNVATTVTNGVPLTTVTGSGAAPQRVAFTDTTTGVSNGDAATYYSGPVNYLQWQYIWNSADGVAMAGQSDNMFLHGGSGADAISAHGGSNVIDGGAGSNFLVGATGADGGSDTFYIDGRGGAVTWGSIVNFHHGDAATVFGFNDNSTLPAFTVDGATGYTGATIHSELGGAGSGVNGSLTFVGLSVADAQSKLTVQTGHFGTAGQADYLGYLYIAYTG